MSAIDYKIPKRTDSVLSGIMKKDLDLTLVLLKMKMPKMFLVFATTIEPGQYAHLCSLTRQYTVG